MGPPTDDPGPDPDLVRTIVDALPVAIWVARAPDGEFIYANQRFREIMGMTARPDVKAGEYAAPYGIHDRDGALYPEERMPFVQALRTGEAVVVDDIVIHRPDGNRAYIRAFATPVARAGSVAFVAIAFIDITPQVEAERARDESEARLAMGQRMESIGRLAGGIAHDFNNLLTVQRLVADQLLDTETDPARRDALTTIEDITVRAEALTRSLLGFARRGKHRSEPVRLTDVLGRLGEIVRRALGAGVEVEMVASTAGGHVLGDPTQLEQVVMNLVVNARDAMRDRAGPRRLRIEVADVTLSRPASHALGLHDGPYVRLTVTDTGPGIPSEHRTRVFEPYFSTKSQGPERGTGLGLATVYGIVTNHGGAVDVADGPDGSGTEMRVYLPSAPSAPEPDARTTPTPRAGRGGKILLVDDDPLVRSAICRALRRLGYEVVEAADGVLAVAAFDAQHDTIAAVLLDLVMPNMDGSACFTALQAVDPSVPVVLMTGHSDNEIVQTLLDRGVRGFLPKPCGVQEIARAISAVVGP